MVLHYKSVKGAHIMRTVEAKDSIVTDALQRLMRRKIDADLKTEKGKRIGSVYYDATKQRWHWYYDPVYTVRG